MFSKRNLLLVVVIAQFFLLTGIYIKAALPLWMGDEIRVMTEPVDPRSLFRGNYARLNYDFSQIPKARVSQLGDISDNEVVYVSLEPNSQGIYSFSSVSLEPPEEGVFLRGRASGGLRGLGVNYGLEAFFVPKEKALQLEKDLRFGAIAVLMVDSSGHARIKEILPK